MRGLILVLSSSTDIHSLPLPIPLSFAVADPTDPETAPRAPLAESRFPIPSPGALMESAAGTAPATPVSPVRPSAGPALAATEPCWPEATLAGAA